MNEKEKANFQKIAAPMLKTLGYQNEKNEKFV